MSTETRNRGRFRAIGVIGGIVLAPVALSLPFLLVGQYKAYRLKQIRPPALRATMERARPLIRAIERYSADHGSPPERLDLLVPRYLPSIPSTGALAADGWFYVVRGKSPQNVTKAPEDVWVLGVAVKDAYSPQVFSFGDVFVFHPSGRYPHAAYGGILERIGDWGYYYE